MMISPSQIGFEKIPSFMRLRNIELIRSLNLEGRSVLELSNGLDGVACAAEACFRSAEISSIFDTVEKYDVAILHSPICHIPKPSLSSVLRRLGDCIRERLVIVEDLAGDRFSEKELEMKEIIWPGYASNFWKNIKLELEAIGFKNVERIIWISQIPLSEDEVARKIRILNRMAIERKIDLSEEFQELIAIYRTSTPVFTPKDLLIAHKC